MNVRGGIVGFRIGLETLVEGDDVQRLEQLALVLVQALDHHVEQRRGIDLDAGAAADDASERLLVLLLDRAPGLLELDVVNKGLQPGQPVQVVQPALADL